VANLDAPTVPFDDPEATTLDIWEERGPERCSGSGATPGGPLRPGSVVLSYRVERMLGRGGQGEVYLARDVQRERDVALKTIRREWLDSPAMRRRFQAEVAAAAALRHPNIVQAYGVFEHESQPFLVMEYVPATTLARALRRKLLSNRQLLALFITCCRTMTHAHANGILHLDLKPQNILLTPEGVPKVSDFGNARKLWMRMHPGRAPAGRRVAGSPPYMAPEQAASRHDLIGPHTDVYALGAILYEMLLGEAPHMGDTPWGTVRHVLEADPVPPAERDPFIGWDLSAICMKALARDWRARYIFPGQLADDLEGYLRGEPVEARKG